MKITDITGILENGMWSYGDLWNVEIKPATCIDEEGVSSHKINLFTISGTYFETPAHIFKDVPTIDEVPLEKMITDAAIIKLPQSKKAREHITVEDLESAQVEIKEGDALLVHTGWDRMWNKEGFVLQSPHLTDESVDWISEKKISILGADIPCYDDPQREAITKGLDLLERIFKQGILILAPVVNLGKVEAKRAKLIVLPLKVKGVSGAPCRAIIIEKE